MSEVQRKEFARRIKHERMKKDWSQVFVAEQLGLTRSNTYCNWESANRTPNSKFMILKLANLFGCTADYLMGKDPDEDFLRELEITDTAEILTKYNLTLDRKPLTKRQASMALNLIRTFVESERQQENHVV